MKCERTNEVYIPLVMKYTFRYGEFRLTNNRFRTLRRCSCRLSPQGNRVTRRITTFRSTTDRKYDGGKNFLETLDKLIVEGNYLPVQIFSLD